MQAMLYCVQCSGARLRVLGLRGALGEYRAAAAAPALVPARDCHREDARVGASTEVTNLDAATGASNGFRMVEIEVRGDSLEIQVLGMHKLWALTSRLTVPLAAVKRVRRLEPGEARGWWKGWRVPGTHVPGFLIAGTFLHAGERHFWDVRHAERAIAVELSAAPYDRLFVEVDDPDKALALLNSAGLPS
jgi:hypothetical protein